MKTSFFTLLIASALGIAACSGQPQGGSQAASNQTAATAASDLAVNQGKTQLKSSDGKIVIDTFGQFSDKIGHADFMPDDVKAEQVKLLQQDSVTGTLFSVILVGETKAVAQYFDHVKAGLEADKSLKDMKIDYIAANNMGYSFSQADEQGNVLLNERCMMMLHGESVYNICVSNPESSQDELAQALKFVDKIN